MEWIVIAGLFLFLTQTDAGTVVGSWFQRGILWTGLFRPSVDLPEGGRIQANFNIPLVDLDGEPVRFGDLRGKVIFMNVWASWCSPCLAEMPFIQKLYDTTRGEQIAFAMISLDETRETAKAFIDKNAYTFPVFYPSGALPSPYTSSIVPTTYIISPEGEVVVIHSGMANYDSDTFRRFLLDQAKRVSANPLNELGTPPESRVR